MKIYNYSPITFEYISEIEAKKDPLTPGRYLIPANATDIKVILPNNDNEIPVFDKMHQKWELKKDYRNKPCWYIITDTNRGFIAGQPAVITTIGDPPDHITLLDPSDLEFPIWSHDHWEESKYEALMFYLSIIDENVKALQRHNFEYDGINYYSDNKNIQNTRFLMESSYIDSILWKTADIKDDGVYNIYTTFNKDQFIDFSNYYFNWLYFIWREGDIIKNKLNDHYFNSDSIESVKLMKQDIDKYIEDNLI